MAALFIRSIALGAAMIAPMGAAYVGLEREEILDTSIITRVAQHIASRCSAKPKGAPPDARARLGLALAPPTTWRGQRLKLSFDLSLMSRALPRASSAAPLAAVVSLPTAWATFLTAFPTTCSVLALAFSPALMSVLS
ncbi:hypothetical protein [Streptomyces sp. NPDC056192]|uniref:hypothetical protein n=1 Tax=unclassified Streptomyces TaxID=2593676 RepID=UPI0035DE7854